MRWEDLSEEQVRRLREALSGLRLKGGQPLPGGDGPSPRIAVRLPPALHAHVLAVAGQRRVSVSVVVREALEAWSGRPIP